MAEAHLVPRTYLKGFADRTRGLAVYSSEPGKPAYHERDVKRVATRQDFYVLYGSDGTPNQALEDALATLESDLRGILKKVKRHGYVLSDDDISRLDLFAAMQEARSERRHNALAEPLTQLRDDLARELRAEGQSKEQVEASLNLFFRKHIASGDFAPDPGNISLLMVPEGIKVRYKFFRAMSKCVVESGAHDFFTCDDPVTRTETFHPPKIGFDYLSISAEVTYPLTRRHCLVLSYMPLQPRATADKTLVSVINARTAGNALREVYAHPKGSPREQQPFTEDIMALALRRRPLVPFLIADPQVQGIPDIVGLARDLDLPSGYLAQVNKPFIDYIRHGGSSPGIIRP